jgi:DNA-binding NarL/FixJ family response regulator
MLQHDATRNTQSMQSKELSPKSRTILAAIAQGHSYDQILAGELDLTYHDIFNAAAEALTIADSAAQTYRERLDEVQQLHPRAYEKWADEEDAHLTQLFRSGKTVQQIAKTLQRQPSAIGSRLKKLDVVQLPTFPFQLSPLQRMIIRLFVMGGTIAQSSVGCQASLLGHPAVVSTRPSPTTSKITSP